MSSKFASHSSRINLPDPEIFSRIPIALNPAYSWDTSQPGYGRAAADMGWTHE
jgi:hypothetical protein